MGVLDALLDSQLRESRAWDENLHPRDLLGQFTKKVAGLRRGEEIETPGGVIVRHRGNRQTVRVGPNGREETVGSPAAAAQKALDLDARQTSARSLGGAQAFSSFDAYAKSREGTKAPAAKKPAARSGRTSFEHVMPDGTVERRSSGRPYTHVVTAYDPRVGRRVLLGWSESEGNATKAKGQWEARGFRRVRAEPIRAPKALDASRAGAPGGGATDNSAIVPSMPQTKFSKTSRPFFIARSEAGFAEIRKKKIDPRDGTEREVKMGSVSREKYGSSRTDTKWFATSVLGKPKGSAFTRDEAIRLLIAARSS